MLSWISHWSASTRVPGSQTDRPLRPKCRTVLRVSVSTERDRRSMAFSGMSWMSQSARVSTASVSRVTPSAEVRWTVQSVRWPVARAATWMPAPLISYSSQPTASTALPSPFTESPAPDAWCTRQFSSRGWAPPRTVIPACPAATTSHSSKTPPASSSTLMPTPPALSTVHRRTVGRAPPRTSMPAADRVTTRSPDSSGAPSSTRSAGEAESVASRCRSWTEADARMVTATPSVGAIRTEPRAPSAPRSVTARSSTRFSRYVPAGTVSTSPSPAASRAAASVLYSPVRRRHRDVPECVTWTEPCAMALSCPHLVRLLFGMAESVRGCPHSGLRGPSREAGCTTVARLASGS